MKRKEAVDIYLNNTVHDKVIIDRIQKWDTKKSISENAELLGIHACIARQLVLRYKIKFKSISLSYKKHNRAN